jgi:hypothetical protein
VLKQDGARGNNNYITVVEWASFAAFQNARDVMAVKHKEVNRNPQELFNRLQIKAELGTYVPVTGEAEPERLPPLLPVLRQAPGESQ